MRGDKAARCWKRSRGRIVTGMTSSSTAGVKREGEDFR